MHQCDAVLTPVAPFDFQQSLRFLCSFEPTRDDHEADTRHWRRGLRVEGRLCSVDVSSVGRVDAPALLCRVTADHPVTDHTLQAAAQRVGWALSLQDDLEPLYARAREDAAFLPRAQHWFGLHQPCFFTPFEIAAWAVLTQRTPIPRALRLKASLVAALGDHVQGLPVFPDAAVVARAPLEQLVSLTGNARKARYLHAVAHAFSNVDELWLRQAPVTTVVEWLRNIPGLGPWSSAFVALRGLGRTEHLPVEQARVLEAAQALYRRPLTLAQAQDIADGYGRLKGYWALYIRAGMH